MVCPFFTDIGSIGRIVGKSYEVEFPKVDLSEKKVLPPRRSAFATPFADAWNVTVSFMVEFVFFFRKFTFLNTTLFEKGLERMSRISGHSNLIMLNILL